MNAHPIRRLVTVLTTFALAGGAATAAALPSGAAAPPAWTTATKTVTRTPTPTPVVTGIRVGRHATFDRLVVDLRGPAPGYRVGYVRTLREDASGKVVDLRGPASLQITLTPADAHTVTTGASTLRTPPRKRWFYPEIEEYAVIGDFEAVVTVGVGLAHEKPFRVFTLSSPTRIVVDVAH